ncbi:Rab3 GTPase-activating protein catalytic subunit [Macleaya cordata]|uniref:Rab3 GTPase-activating protein catalytic subunit n=1 Tax=Macleaya cordata TaxID=56857 RepID=A0A200QG39_MACCD|nr:Rab3 GTPase-activating protein catalytic subunit [Macleaya cordata]
METSSSFVSKARTAFHSAAAKAEKVLTDIKVDLKSDPPPEQSEDQSDKISKKLPELESISRKSNRELGRKQDWQDRFKNMRRGKKGAEKKENSPNSSSNLPGLDESVDQIDLGNCPKTKESEKGPPAEEENSNDMAKIPPASVIKQLAVAVEAGKKFKSMKDFLASTRDSSPVRERAGLSFSAMKSLVLRDKEDKSTSEFGDDDEVVSFIKLLFDAEGQFCIRKNQSGSAMASVPRDIHAAPPESFVVRLSEIIGRFMTLRKMALFWWRVVEELRRLWSEGQPVPRVPLDENPDLNSCLLHQQLQVINCCISRKRRRVIATESLDSVLREAGSDVGELAVSPSSVSSGTILYARLSSGDLVLRLGADHPSEGLTMLETSEPVYAPVTQEGPVLTEDLIKETEELVLRTGSVGAGCSQLLSDMQAFKAANPGCILEDFVRWHSPPDWTETNPDDETKDCFDEGEATSKRGFLSTRMQKEGNLWRELWETSKPLPAVKQTPLFDEDLAVEGILNFLEDITPSELFQQLFVSLLASAFVIAEGPLSTNSNLSKLFFECKDYVVATCQNAKWIDNIDDLCQVYGTVETILVHPEDGLKIINQSEETTAADEPKHRFKKLILKFSGKDRQFLRRQSSKNNQNQEENPPRQVFPNLFDGKSSLFSKKPPKPISTSEVDTSLFPDEMIGQVFHSCKYAI